jgi:hypothetical protein
MRLENSKYENVALLRQKVFVSESKISLLMFPGSIHEQEKVHAPIYANSTFPDFAD